MYDGFIKAAAITPKVRVADVNFNCSRINEKAREAADRGAKLIVFPELSITGCSCADLFLQPLLIARALQGLKDIAADTDWIEALIFVGLPLEVNSKLYDAAAVIYKGEVLAFIPKRSIPDHGENSGSRYFARGNAEPVNIGFNGKDVPFGQNIMFTIPAVTGIQIAVEIGDDMYAPNTPATRHALNGANVIVNLAAECECIGRNAVRQTKVMDNSSRLICGYIFANAGYGESTTDLVYNGHNLIAENGEILCEGEGCGITCTDLDVERIRLERRRVNTFDMVDFADYTKNMEHYITVPVDMECRETKLDRVFEADPFVPACEIKRKERCAEILKIQTLGLARRLEHVKADKALIGLSGGLDSTLSLLVTGKAFDVLGRDHKDIIAVTMPCFGTSDRTYNNACTLAKCLGAELGEIRIDKAITQHFEDISHSMEELEGLAEAAGIETLGIMTQNAEKIHAAAYIGKGKLEELAELVHNMEADLVVFNDELSGMQLRNIEEAVGVRVIDRTMLILDIFAEIEVIRYQRSSDLIRVELIDVKVKNFIL